MTTVRTDPVGARPATSVGARRIVLEDVPWQSYLTIGDALPDRPGLRITYDRGRLELMVTSPEHEFSKKLLGHLVVILVEEHGLTLATAGNMTFQREDLQRAIEPDDCFWIEHEPAMRGKRNFDPAVDPPPDLMLEIEISRSAIPRMAVHAALGVPQVWRYDGHALWAERLQSDRTWQRAERSPTFPKIPLREVARFLDPDPNQDFLSILRQFRRWVQTKLE